MVKAHPRTDASRVLLRVYEAGLRGVGAERVVADKCALQGSSLTLGRVTVELDAFENLYLCGAGKASCGIAKALALLVQGWVSGGLIVTKYGHGLPIEGVEVLEAGHPVLDEASLHAGEAMWKFRERLTSRDLVIFVLSGGASSLMELPPAGVSLERLRDLNEEMLRSPLSITDINRQRKDMSLIKGGGLADRFSPARTVCLVLSDVLGDDFGTIGSGPLWKEEGSIPHVLLGNLQTMIDAARDEAEKLGFRAVASPEWIFTGEARKEAARFVDEALKRGCQVAIGGGEPVVTVRGHGRGGRCQEFATAAAELIQGRARTSVLAGSSDGSDGPTPWAGGLVDEGSAQRAGMSVSRALETSASSDFLASCDGLIQTGPTQTNVNDVYLLANFGGEGP